jgi:hypothetical protein
MSEKKKSVLGRGLGALLEANDTSERGNDKEDTIANPGTTTTGSVISPFRWK